MTTDQRVLLAEARNQVAAGLAKLDQALATEQAPTPSPSPSPLPSPPATPARKKRKIAVCIGHSRPGDSGASSVGNVTEWHYNKPIGLAIVAKLNAAGHDAVLYDKYVGDSYTTAMSWLTSQITTFGADVAVELHFNAADAAAKGYEYLYWGTSNESKKLAQFFLARHKAALPAMTSRGIKPKTASDRGSYFLQKCPCPCVITEPFFGSNPTEWEVYKSAPSTLVDINTAAVLDFVNALP